MTILEDIIMKFVDLNNVENRNYSASSTCNCGSCNCNCGSGSACHNKCASGETINLKEQVEKVYED